MFYRIQLIGKSSKAKSETEQETVREETGRESWGRTMDGGILVPGGSVHSIPYIRSTAGRAD